MILLIVRRQLLTLMTLAKLTVRVKLTASFVWTEPTDWHWRRKQPMQ